MSLKDYLRLAGKGIKNLDKIAEGVMNEVKSEYGMLSQEEQEEITRRRLICSTCPLMSLNAKENDTEYRKLYNKDFKAPEGRENEKFCSVCECNIHYKTSSLSSNCGLSYYNEHNPEVKEELKWVKFKK
jgi:hypothetical protein